MYCVRAIIACTCKRNTPPEVQIYPQSAPDGLTSTEPDSDLEHHPEVLQAPFFHFIEHILMLLLFYLIMDFIGTIELISALRDIEKPVRRRIDRLPFRGEGLPAFKLLKDCESDCGKAIKKAMSLAPHDRMHSIPELVGFDIQEIALWHLSKVTRMDDIESCRVIPELKALRRFLEKVSKTLTGY